MQDVKELKLPKDCYTANPDSYNFTTTQELLGAGGFNEAPEPNSVTMALAQLGITVPTTPSINLLQVGAGQNNFSNKSILINRIEIKAQLAILDNRNALPQGLLNLPNVIYLQVWLDTQFQGALSAATTFTNYYQKLAPLLETDTKPQVGAGPEYINVPPCYRPPAYQHRFICLAKRIVNSNSQCNTNTGTTLGAYLNSWHIPTVATLPYQPAPTYSYHYIDIPNIQIPVTFDVHQGQVSAAVTSNNIFVTVSNYYYNSIAYYGSSRITYTNIF